MARLTSSGRRLKVARKRDGRLSLDRALGRARAQSWATSPQRRLAGASRTRQCRVIVGGCRPIQVVAPRPDAGGDDRQGTR
jgi:hypothetical protein